MAAVAAHSRPHHVCGRRRRCGRSSRFRADGPSRQSRDRCFFRCGMCCGASDAARRGRIANQCLCTLCADVLRRRDAGQRPHPCGAGPAARSAAGTAARGHGCRHAGRGSPRCAAARRLVAVRLAGRGRGIRLLFAFEHLHRRPPGTGAGDDRPALQRHA